MPRAENPWRGDDAMILVLVCMLIPIFVRLMRLKRQYTLSEFGLLLLCVLLSAFRLWLTSLDCASVWDTAFLVLKRVIGVAFMSLPISLIVGLTLYRYDNHKALPA